MGNPLKLLLVKAFWLCLALAGHSFSAQADSGKVDARDYHAFWMWAAVRPQPVLKQADTLYLHQAEIITLRGQPVFQRRGTPYSAIKVPALWVSVRIATLEVSDQMIDNMIRLRENWIAAGNRVTGIQIDFDAASYQLDKYAAFLQRLRKKLPPDCQLSVTGLLDWAKTGSIAELNRLPVDEVVIQTYQGRHTVSRYQDYLPVLMKLKIPFKVGLAQNGDWDPGWQKRLAASPYYRGEVVFLLNE